MAFKICQGSQAIEQAWFPIDSINSGTTFLNVGQLVKLQLTAFNGMNPLAIAAGIADITNKQAIFGVVTGTNNYPLTETFNATYGQFMTTALTQAAQAAIQKMGAEGMHPKGDTAPMVQVAMLTPYTTLEGPIYNATYGTAPTLLTCTTANAAGTSVTTNACDVITVAEMCTIYCRTGANAGIYRILHSASTTVHTETMAFPNAIAVGDTFVVLPYRQGQSYAQINSTAGYIGMCFDCAVGPVTNYFRLDVKELDFAKSGQEKLIFRFNAIHFLGDTRST